MTTFLVNLYHKMRSHIHVPRKSFFGFIAGGIGGVVILCLLGLLLLTVSYHNQIYPGVRIGSFAVGGLSASEAELLLTNSVTAYRQQWPLVLSDDGHWLSVSFDEQAIDYDIEGAVAQAMNVGRSVSLVGLKELAALVYAPTQVALPAEVDDEWLMSVAASLSAEADVPAVPPQLILNDENQTTVAKVVPGENGRVLDQQRWKESFAAAISQLRLPERQLPMKVETMDYTAEQLDQTAERANMLLASTLVIQFSPENAVVSAQQWQLSGEELLPFIRFDGGFNEDLLTEYLTSVASSIDQAPQNAVFQFDETSQKVVEFVPAEPGLQINVASSLATMVAALKELEVESGEKTIELAYGETQPEVSLAEVNRLGIKEVIGVGTSSFKGSIASRVYNVALAASRLNGTLIKPGEEFSFNAAVGEISGATGYKAAYIIQNGRTELGDGGGVCQDSTTVFRAALNAGLPITMRRGHAYRVGYYEQDVKAGIDATVYSPTTDFRFVNDTPGHILIQTETDTENLTLKVLFFGTDDGRVATITDHVVWDVTPPPPDVYIDDPTLAPGQVKQIDWRASGAKAKFTYTVVRGNEVLQDQTFVTTYKPWAAVYLRGPQQ